MGILGEAVTWWNGQTTALRLFTMRRGQRVGEDAEGNVFYQTQDGKRRWVIYNGDSDASRVSAEWHGWLHHTYNEPPTESPLPRKSWEKEHLANQSGTDQAYHPKGSLLAREPVEVKSGYQAWQPES